MQRIETLLGFFPCFVQRSQGLLLMPVGSLDVGFGIPITDRPSTLGNIMEDGKEPVIFLHTERVVFVIVASGTLHGDPHPGRTGGFHPIRDILSGDFLWNGSSLGIIAVVAIEPSGNDLIHFRHGQQIPGQLLDGELVVGHVLIERMDDPVPPGPHFAFSVVLISMSVCIASRIQPW